MKLKFLGAAGTVTGSSYVLTSSEGQSILIDMGMFQGTKDIEAMNYNPFDYPVDQLSGALLTHAHLDHCGRMPMLEYLGYKGEVWMTPPTRQLTELVLLDSARIAEKYSDKPLYSTEDVEKLTTRFRTKNFSETINLGHFEATFIKAGHLLGAASILIKDTTSKDKIRSILFSGDLGNAPEELLQEYEFVKSADAVVMESTYGNRLHSDADPYRLLQEEINAVEENHAVLMIPSFSLEKTQVLLHMIGHLKAEGKVSPETLIYMDSPMAQSATSIYEKNIDYMNQHLQSDHQQQNPYEFPGLKIIYSHKNSLKIREQDGPKVIIAGAGMMTGGRIVSHAREYLAQPQNRIFFVGYQGEDTLGREILEGKKQVKIGVIEVPVAAHVGRTDGMSGHADQAQLLNWLSKIKDVKKVFLTHGENEARAELAQRVQADLGHKDLALPYLNQEINL